MKNLILGRITSLADFLASVVIMAGVGFFGTLGIMWIWGVKLC